MFANVAPPRPLFEEYAEHNRQTNLWDVVVYFSDITTMTFSLTIGELKSSSVLTYGAYDGRRYLIRRTTTLDNNLLLATHKESRILSRGFEGVVDYEQTIAIPLYTYLLLKPRGIKLELFLRNWAKDIDLKKRILLRVIWILNDLHEAHVLYNKDLCGGLFVNYGRDKDQLTVQLLNFDLAEEYATPIPYTARMSDFRNFGNLILFVMSNGQVTSWPKNARCFYLLEHYYDRLSIIDLLELINNPYNIVALREITTHPALWSDAKAIQFYNKLYVMTTFETNPIVLPEKAFFQNNWIEGLHEVLQGGILDQQKKSLILGKGKLTKASVNITTLQGLVACIRHSCDIHHFNMTQVMQGLVDEPPKGIKTFIKAFPRLLIFLFYFVKEHFDGNCDREETIYKALKDFYVVVELDNYGNSFLS